MGGIEENPRAELRKRALLDRQPFSNAAGEVHCKRKEMHRTTANPVTRIAISNRFERASDPNTKG